MPYFNVPDDWGSYYTKCEHCGSRYHLSEGGCGCGDDLVLCAGSTARGACYAMASVMVTFAGRDYCKTHLACDGCGEQPSVDQLTPQDGDIYCPACMAEE